MEATVFNPAQRHILRLMSTFKTEQQVEELSQVLSDYYARKIDEEMDELWDQGKLSHEKMKEFRTQHFRTPYNV